MDTHCVYWTPLPDHVDETAQLRILQWPLYVKSLQPMNALYRFLEC